MSSDVWVNPKTGEVVDSLHVIRGAKYPKNVEFMTMFRDGWDYLSTLRLAPTTTAVMFKLMTKLDYENWMSISQETIAQEIGLKRPHVTDAINELAKAGVIEVSKDKTDKRRNAYRLNASLGWKGDARQWVQHIQQRAMEMGTNVIPLPGVVTPER